MIASIAAVFALAKSASAFFFFAASNEIPWIAFTASFFLEFTVAWSLAPFTLLIPFVFSDSTCPFNDVLSAGKMSAWSISVVLAVAAWLIASIAAVLSMLAATVAASLKLEARIPGLVFISSLISITDKTKYFPSARGFK